MLGDEFDQKIGPIQVSTDDSWIGLEFNALKLRLLNVGLREELGPLRDLTTPQYEENWPPPRVINDDD